MEKILEKVALNLKVEIKLQVAGSCVIESGTRLAHCKDSMPTKVAQIRDWHKNNLRLIMVRPEKIVCSENLSLAKAWRTGSTLFAIHSI